MGTFENDREWHRIRTESEAGFAQWLTDYGWAYSEAVKAAYLCGYRDGVSVAGEPGLFH